MFLELNLFEERISFKRGRGGKIKVDLELIQFGQSKFSSQFHQHFFDEADKIANHQQIWHTIIQ